MADGVDFTEEDFHVAHKGLVTQMMSHECYSEYCLNNGFQEFIKNTAKVIASERAYSRMLQNTLHERDGLK